ncbi:MAG: PEP-CTERM sorting domain-containing protein [Verrucomicrobiaceae bacterium]|nr:PEP-CTERM sorting domain-containing protein [Verrucomicrobiaceae bacterium]
MSGNFSNVTWEGTNLGSMSGNFSVQIAWQDANSNGIPWSVDSGLDAIVFDTEPGDFLAAGTASITGATAPSGYYFCGLKTLICVNLSSTLESEISVASGKGERLYYGFGTKGEYYEVAYSASKTYTLDETITTTENLSFFYSNDGGTTKTEFTRGLDFDTGIKIGGCVCAVPEPSGAVLLASVGLVLIVRRRRHLR